MCKHHTPICLKWCCNRWQAIMIGGGWWQVFLYSVGATSEDIHTIDAPQIHIHTLGKL